MEGQPLTSSQLSMRSEAAATMSFYKVYVHTDRFHWKGSVLSERVNSASVSSYVHLSPSNSFGTNIHFGRIQFFFRHTFNGTLVNVHWFDGDKELDLVFVDLNYHC